MKNIVLIKIFNEFRDIPLRAPESENNIDNRCWGKHRRLYKKLEKKKFKVRYRVCEFLWSEQKIPENVISVAPSDLDKHLFLEVLLNNRWVVIDCSNDSKLPEYNEWNGTSDCKIGVKYTKILSIDESVEAEEIEKKNYNIMLPKYIAFHKELNKYFNSIRKKS